jgi:hypothetical protein
MDNFNVRCDWFFYEGDKLLWTAQNTITPTGFAEVAKGIENFSSPYLIVGDDITDGFTINEVFRKAITSVSRSGSVVRFRTQLLPAECVGTYQKCSIFIGATATAGTGSMVNILKREWNKTAGTVLTIEARFTVS